MILRGRSWLAALFLAALPAPALALADGLWVGKAECPIPIGIDLVVYRDGATQRALFIWEGTYQPGSPRYSGPLELLPTSGGRERLQAALPGNLSFALEVESAGTEQRGKLTWGPVQCQVAFSSRGPVEVRALPIEASFQQEPMWCWVTVGEMVFKYLGVIDRDFRPPGGPQCDIIGQIYRGSPNAPCSVDCTLCRRMGAGSTREMAGMLSEYPRRLAARRAGVPRVFATVAPPLSDEEVVREIDGGNPVVVGISPSPDQYALARSLDYFPPQHVALVVGYVRTALPGGTFFLVNDPFPFGPQNPYTNAGALPVFTASGDALRSVSYLTPAPALKSHLSWTETILVRRIDVHGRDPRTAR